MAMATSLEAEQRLRDADLHARDPGPCAPACPRRPSRSGCRTCTATPSPPLSSLRSSSMPTPPPMSKNSASADKLEKKSLKDVDFHGQGFLLTVNQMRTPSLATVIKISKKLRRWKIRKALMFSAHARFELLTYWVHLWPFEKRTSQLAVSVTRSLITHH